MLRISSGFSLIPNPRGVIDLLPPGETPSGNGYLVRCTVVQFKSIPAVPVWLSLTGGYVDTAGYVALQGLFTAHVTGNFVTLGASLMSGSSGTLAKLLALPTFCVVVVVTRLLNCGLPARGLPPLRTLLILKVTLLAAAAALALRFGPFPDGDSGPALATGLTLVAAMAIQNAVHRIHLGSAPPTTLMTGTTTQIMIDVTDLTRDLPADQKQVARTRLARMTASVLAFAFGCALAALLYSRAGIYCFVLPPLLGIGTLVLQSKETPVAT